MMVWWGPRLHDTLGPEQWGLWRKAKRKASRWMRWGGGVSELVEAVLLWTAAAMAQSYSCLRLGGAPLAAPG